MVDAERQRRGPTYAHGGLGGKATAAVPAAEAPSAPRGFRASSARRAGGSRPSGLVWVPAEDLDPFEMNRRGLGAAPPHPHVVPRAQCAGHRGQGLRRFERDAGEGRAAPDRELEPDVTTGSDRRRGEHAASNDPGGEVGPLGPGPAGQMVSRALVRPKRHPPVHGLGPYPREGPPRARCVGRSEPEEDGARRVRGDEEASRPAVEAEEEPRETALDLLHARRVHRPGSSPSPALPVGDELPGGVAAGPGHRGRGPDQPLRSPRPSVPRGRPIETRLDDRDRDDLTDRRPVQVGREPLVDGDECRVRPRTPALGRGLHSVPRGPEEGELLLAGRGPSPPVRPDRSPVDVTEAATGSGPMAEPCGEGCVPPRPPRDVGVEADEPRLTQEVESPLVGERDQLGQYVRRATAARAVGVVHADPDRPTPVRTGPSGRAT
jgi:hypothetical protein